MACPPLAQPCRLHPIANADEKFGLKTRWVVNTGAGAVNIKLYHEPTSKFDLNNPGGEVDFDVTFPVRIQ